MQHDMRPKTDVHIFPREDESYAYCGRTRAHCPRWIHSDDYKRGEAYCGHCERSYWVQVRRLHG